MKGETGPGSPSDERRALLQLVPMFEVYPGATGLSHLVGLILNDAARWRIHQRQQPETTAKREPAQSSVAVTCADS